MCECKTELQEKLLTRFVASAPQATNHGATLQGYAFAVVGDCLMTMGYLPVELSAEYPLKAGGKKLKKTSQNMFFTFCPYCGERYVPLKTEAA